MANYSRERSKFGGYVGSIQIHTSPGLGSDPTSAIFNDILPAGFLRCDGSILEAREYLALSQILGVGQQSRFAKENSILRDANPQLNDLGTFQLPDLGSKVLIPNRGSGDYLNIDVESTGENRVGPEIQALSNVGNRIEVSYLGNFRGQAQTNIEFNSNSSYSMPRQSEVEFLEIENFQGHAHNSNAIYLNFSAQHLAGEPSGAIGSGKERGASSGNSGAGMYTDISAINVVSGESSHSHKLTKPTIYTQNFRYSFNNFDISADPVSSYVDVDFSKDRKLDTAVAPFILVEYIIKY
jgi:hypothetical protein